MLHLTLDDDANALLTQDPFALVVGMLLDQQFPMERAFAGPFLLAQRLGTPMRLDPAQIVATPEDDLLAMAKGPPAIHRYPGSMIGRIRELAQIVIDDYDSDASRIWRDAPTARQALSNLEALPGFGPAKSKIFLALIGKQVGGAPSGWQRASSPYGRAGTSMSIADVTSPESLQKVREWKQKQKAKAKRQTSA